MISIIRVWAGDGGPARWRARRKSRIQRPSMRQGGQDSPSSVGPASNQEGINVDRPELLQTQPKKRHPNRQESESRIHGSWKVSS